MSPTFQVPREDVAETRVWSPQQQAIFDEVAKVSGPNLLVEAVAGSGKTSTLVEACKRMDGMVAFAAYNKSIAAEIGAKVSAYPHVQAGTFHAFGLRAWKGVEPRCRVEGDKLKILQNQLDHPWPTRKFVAQLVSLCKQSMIRPEEEDFESYCLDIIEHHDMESDLPIGLSLSSGVDLARHLLKASLSERSFIDFDDMIYLPLVMDVRFPQFDWVLIDEAQDSNRGRRTMARKMLRDAGRLLAVGDPCQPTGTKIHVVRKKGDRWNPEQIELVKIEELEIGDQVISYNHTDCSFIKGRTIQGITKRPFSGELVVVQTAQGHCSAYTPNHHCFVSFSALRSKWAVYIMQRGQSFRIGRSAMDYSSAVGNGPAARLRGEDADAIWILDCFDTKQQAIAFEAMISARYQIPQLMFKINDSHTITQDALDVTWHAIGDLTERAMQCLAAYHRSIEHPLFTLTQTGQRTLKRPIITHASNLMLGCLVLPYSGKVHAKQSEWLPITVTYELYTGNVYSLSVSDEQLYCADGLITHNCQAIYGFTGADNDALDIIQRDFNATRMPLTVSYRCPQAVVRHAQELVSHIEAAPWAKEGAVHELIYTVRDEEGHTGEELFWSEWVPILKREDAILCRNTKPLISLAFELIRKDHGCHVEGRDIGMGLVKIVKRTGCDTVREIRASLDEHLSAEYERLLNKNKEAKAESLKDQIETIFVILDQLSFSDPLYKVEQKILGLFGDTEPGKPASSTTLSTVHKAKGREWNRVFLWDRNKFMPSKWAKQPWQLQQETNLTYVAITRAKETLVEVEI